MDNPILPYCSFLFFTPFILTTLRHMNCKNCLKYGHTFYHCKKPVRSYGIILYRATEDKKKYLMICRKHTFGFTTIMRGKFSSLNPTQIQTHVDSMTNYEKEIIQQKSFSELWEYLLGNISSSRRNHDRSHAEFKFNAMRHLLLEAIAASPTHWEEAEWEFPKGRMQHGENNLECALREFEEETHISKHNVRIIYNLCPFEEIYKGSNDKMYQITYFLAQLKHEEPNLLSFQEEEVSRMEWKDLEQCLADIRPNNQEKKDLVSSLEEILNTYAVV
jgi:8-oxo-dGTP pyrophosphatase MutT (NUDIX family)